MASLGNPDWKISGRAEGLLLRYYLPDVFEAATEACDDPDPQVRFRSVWLLAHTKDPRGYETILRLTKDEDEAVRYDATVALGVLGDLRGVEHLIGLLSQLEDATPAGDALARLGVQILADLVPLISSTNLTERFTAMMLIGTFASDTKDVRLLEHIRPCLTDGDKSLRTECGYWFNELSTEAEPRLPSTHPL